MAVAYCPKCRVPYVVDNRFPHKCGNQWWRW